MTDREKDAIVRAISLATQAERAEAQRLRDELAETKKVLAKRQRLLDDMFALGTMTYAEVVTRFGESRLKDDSARWDYAVELLADVCELEEQA